MIEMGIASMVLNRNNANNYAAEFEKKNRFLRTDFSLTMAV